MNLADAFIYSKCPIVLLIRTLLFIIFVSNIYSTRRRDIATMRRTTRSQTATQRHPAQPTVMQPAISEDQRAHAMNNVLEIESIHPKEEIKEEAAVSM